MNSTTTHTSTPEPGSDRLLYAGLQALKRRDFRLAIQALEAIERTGPGAVYRELMTAWNEAADEVTARAAAGDAEALRIVSRDLWPALHAEHDA